MSGPFSFHFYADTMEIASADTAKVKLLAIDTTGHCSIYCPILYFT